MDRLGNFSLFFQRLIDFYGEEKKEKALLTGGGGREGGGGAGFDQLEALKLIM